MAIHVTFFGLTLVKNQGGNDATICIGESSHVGGGSHLNRPHSGQRLCLSWVWHLHDVPF